MKPLDPRLLKHARAARQYIVFTAATGVLLALLVVAQVLLIANIVGPAVAGRVGWNDVAPLVAWLAGVLVARAAVLAIQERFAHRASAAVIQELRGKVFESALQQGPRWLDASRSAEIVTLTTRGLDDLGPYFERYLPQLLLAAILTPTTLGVLLFTDLTSGLLLAFAIPLIPLFMWLVGRLTASYAAQRLVVMDRLGAQVMDLLAGLGTLKALGRENGPGARIRGLANSFNAATLSTLRVAFLSGAILEFIASLSVALVAVVAGTRLVSGSMTLTVGLAAIMLAPEVLMPLRQVGSHFHASTNGIAAAQAAFEILDAPTPSRGKAPAPDMAATRIVAAGLSVAAPGRDLLAPADLSLTIEPATVTVLAGASGSGKSTTALVLLGLLPYDGSVSLEGSTDPIELREINPEDWHRQLTWVPQRPTILPGTIAQNVTGVFDRRIAADESLRDAAAASGLTAVIAALPAGWDTRVGHGGVGLSVGQRQRLALARAFLAPTQIVVLDEPTAHLDSATEADITAAVRQLREQGRTVIVIAHRTGVHEVADQIVSVSSRAGVR